MAKEIETLLRSIPDIELRLAVAGAIAMARDNEQEFKRRYGDVGWQGIVRLCPDTSDWWQP